MEKDIEIQKTIFCCEIDCAYHNDYEEFNCRLKKPKVNFSKQTCKSYKHFTELNFTKTNNEETK